MASESVTLREAALPQHDRMGSKVLDFAGSLATADWEHSTNCPPWTIKTIFSHLVRNAEMFQVMLDSGLRGVRTFPQTPEEREVRQRELASLTVAELTETFDRGHRALRDRLAGLSEAELEAPCPHPRWLMPASWILTQRLVELGCHCWDMESSLGRSAEIDAAVAAVMLPRIIEVNLPLFYQAAAAPIGRWGIHATDLDAGAWVVTSGDGTVSIQRLAAGADVDVAADAPALVRWLYGRASVDALEREGRMRITGERTLLDRWSEAFRSP